MKTPLLGMAAALTLVTCLSGGASAANLIRNGSFESPALASGFALFSTGSTALKNWKIVGAAGNLATVSGTFAQNGFTFPSKSGANWLDLTGLTNTATGIEQIVKTEVGKQYRLTFFVGNLVNPTGIFGSTSTVDVVIDDAEVFSAVNRRLAGATQLTWKKFAVTFTADAVTTKIAFINGDPVNDTANALDAILLVPLP
jgi:hypothetical protein